MQSESITELQRIRTICSLLTRYCLLIWWLFPPPTQHPPMCTQVHPLAREELHPFQLLFHRLCQPSVRFMCGCVCFFPLCRSFYLFSPSPHSLLSQETQIFFFYEVSVIRPPLLTHTHTLQASMKFNLFFFFPAY